MECDARIVRDVEFLLRRLGLVASACFSRSSVHELHGEHPLGLALDAAPQDGEWHRTLAAARAFGWSPSCAAAGCTGIVSGPFRVILYNGFQGTAIPRTADAAATRTTLARKVVRLPGFPKGMTSRRRDVHVPYWAGHR